MCNFTWCLVIMLLTNGIADGFLWPWSSSSTSEDNNNAHSSLSPNISQKHFDGLSENVGSLSLEESSISKLMWNWDIFNKNQGDDNDAQVVTSNSISPKKKNWNLNDINAMNISGAFGHLKMFGDYNSDQHTDMFFVDENRNPENKEAHPLVLSIRSWNANNKMFEESLVYYLPKYMTELANMISLDFNSDGLMDILTVTNADSSNHHFDLTLLLQNPISRTLKEEWTTYNQFYDYQSIVHPFVVDINFDGYPDLMTQTDRTPQGHKQSGGRLVWMNHHGKDFKPYFFDSIELSRFLDGKESSLSPPLSNPHSSAFIDLNGDCVPDIVFDVTDPVDHYRYLEVWLSHLVKNGPLSTELDPGSENTTPNRTHRSRSLDSIFSTFEGLSASALMNDDEYVPKYRISDKHRLQVPKGSHQLSFADTNSDGTLDLIVPVCDNYDSQSQVCGANDQIIVYFNEQPDLCADFTFQGGKPCRVFSDLCQAVNFQWSKEGHVSYINQQKELTIRHFQGSKNYPITLRVGDFDSNGVVDLLVLTQEEESKVSEVLLLENCLGSSNTKQQGTYNWFGTTETSSSYTVQTEQIFNPVSALGVPNFIFEVATFFDFGENGVQDVIGIGYVQQNWWSSLTGLAHLQAVSFIQADHDRLFIKSTGLTGACQSECLIGNFKSYGSLEYGATIKLAGTNLKGYRFARMASPLSQSAYAPLQQPFALIGLGKVNNYIDYLFYGIAYTYTSPFNESNDPTTRRLVESTDDQSSLHYSKFNHYHRWISIIPNSFVIANPYPRDDATRWSLELSLSPSSYFWCIFFSAVVTLTVIGLVICLLDRREKMEDLKEAQGFKRHFITAG